MTKASQGYPYPPDEFDLASADQPRGAHRAPVPWIRRALPFFVVLVVFPALAYVLVTLLSTSGGWSFEPGRGIVATSQSPASSAPGGSTTPDPSTSPSEKTTDETGDETTTEDETTDEGETEESAPELDLAAPVTVYNSTTTAGLAAKAADRLKNAGLTKVTPTNYSGALKRSTVFYAKDELVTTAKLVAETLGITTVTLDADAAGAGISVVLESDYTP